MATIKRLHAIGDAQLVDWLKGMGAQPSKPLSDKSFLSLGLGFTG